MSNCPCGTQKSYDECCKIFHNGQQHAPTAEILMRSRYSAYALGEIDYLVKTIPLLERKAFDRNGAKAWSTSAQWLGLEILSTQGGQVDDTKGSVEFCARYIQNGSEQTHHELSTFKKKDGRWYFMDGKVLLAEPSQQQTVSRNAPCPCGSGKKYKKCCA